MCIALGGKYSASFPPKDTKENRDKNLIFPLCPSVSCVRAVLQIRSVLTDRM